MISEIYNYTNFYFSCFQRIKNFKQNSSVINALSLMTIFSYFTIIIPLSIAAARKICTLYGRVSVKHLSTQDVDQTDNVLFSIKWEQLTPKQGVNFSRKVYLTQDVSPDLERSFPSGCVIKVSHKKQIMGREFQLWPYAEEIAYKIAKVIGWSSEFSKTKILRKFSLQNRKYDKYKKLISPIVSEVPDAETFTIQARKNGVHFPRQEGSACVDQTKIKKLNEQSLQKAFLLGWLLGRVDARCENTIYDPKTGCVSEIDNEMIGYQGYDNNGVLRDFKKVMQKKIQQTLIRQICSLSKENLAFIQKKYASKDDECFNSWIENYGPRLTEKELEERGVKWCLDNQYISELEANGRIQGWQKALSSKWEGIFFRLTWLQEAHQKWRLDNKLVSIQELELEYKAHCEQFQRPTPGFKIG